MRPKSAIKYVLYPGYVMSEYDADEHYIDALHLADCYGVKMSECVVIYEQLGERSYESNQHQHLLQLYPRYRGDYKEHLNKLLKKFVIKVGLYRR